MKPVPTSKPTARQALANLHAGRFNWTTGSALVSPAERPGDPCHAIKDPTIVRHEGKWHLFCTIRSKVRSHQIEYLSFTDWQQADKAKRHVLNITDGYFCAPQVFYYRPHKKWYMIYQSVDKSRKPALQPVFSTTDDLARPASWTKPVLLYTEAPAVKMWIDFWVICDAERAYLFFTSLNGRMWRADTALKDFPHGWSKPAVALKGDVFEASHTYKLKGLDQYLTIIEAQADGRRYFKAYLAEALDGKWRALATTRAKPFASPVNVLFKGAKWTDSISHGELLRSGYDQLLEVDPSNLRMLFQGVPGKDMEGRPYGRIPWRLGVLEPVPVAVD